MSYFPYYKNKISYVLFFCLLVLSNCSSIGLDSQKLISTAGSLGGQVNHTDEEEQESFDPSEDGLQADEIAELPIGDHFEEGSEGSSAAENEDVDAIFDSQDAAGFLPDSADEYEVSDVDENQNFPVRSFGRNNLDQSEERTGQYDSGIVAESGAVMSPFVPAKNCDDTELAQAQFFLVGVSDASIESDDQPSRFRKKMSVQDPSQFDIGARASKIAVEFQLAVVAVLDRENDEKCKVDIKTSQGRDYAEDAIADLDVRLFDQSKETEVVFDSSLEAKIIFESEEDFADFKVELKIQSDADDLQILTPKWKMYRVDKHHVQTEFSHSGESTRAPREFNRQAGY